MSYLLTLSFLNKIGVGKPDRLYERYKVNLLSKTMRHRHLSNSFPRFGIDQQDNNHTPVEHSYFPTGRGVAVPPENSPFIGQMNHHISRSGGITHRLNLEGGSSSSRANEYHHPPPPPSNINMEIVQPLTPPFSHQPITDNRSLPPGGHVHPHYTNYNNVPNANPAHDMEAGSGPLNHHPTGKRKRSSSFNSLYTASTSSSSQMPMELEKQTPPPFRGSLTIDGQDSSRNVRRRYRHDDMESESTNHIPNHFYQPTTSHPPPNYPSTPPVPHYPAPSPHIRLPPPDISGARHEMGQFHGGDSVFSRPSSQNLHGHHHHHHHGNNHTRSRIQSSYGNGSRYSHYAHGGTSSTNAPESFSSRNSRHCSPGGWRGSYRSGRPRIAVERFHSVVDVTESHNRIGHDTMMMVDRASFYGNSRNFSDQYRDLRLDIDNMSYEELLNLEERIGSVNTGLSEDSMSKFLKEKVYYSSDQHHEEEVSCPICLEEYKNGDNIGKMEKCGHGYHVDCIKKWLMMKKLCPICKTECSNQEPRVEG